MKKTSKKKLIKALLAPIGKGILIFAVFGMALYAYAITFPGAEPGPVTGVVGTFVGISTDDADGDDPGSYIGANDYCVDAFEGSHVCTAMEMINSYNNNVAALTTESGQVWINNGPPGHDETLANDCQGWTVGVPSQSGYGRYGSIWNLDAEKAALQFCDTTLYFACCK